jgi:hypothetical protein
LRQVPCAGMPSPLPRRNRSRAWLARLARATAAFPEIWAGRLPRYLFRGLLGVHSRYGLPARRVAYKRPSASKASTASLPPQPLRLLPAGARVAGRVYPPLRTCAFSRRTRLRRSRRSSGNGKRTNPSVQSAKSADCSFVRGRGDEAPTKETGHRFHRFHCRQRNQRNQWLLALVLPSPQIFRSSQCPPCLRGECLVSHCLCVLCVLGG